jgi:hypothetical protein
MIKTAHMNILESSTVSLSAGGASPDTPLSRLWDRNISRPFIADSASTLTVKLDQGASPSAVDRLIIPSGHNLSGATLSLTHSSDDIDYTDALSPWQAGAGLITVQWQGITRRYWKFTVSGAGAAPEFAELFLTETYEWQRNPSRPTGRLSPEFNVKRIVSSGGQERHLVLGPPRSRRSYGLLRMGSQMRSEMEALEYAWSGARPFWLFDHGSEWLFGSLDAGLCISEISEGLSRMRFDFTEAL